MYVCLRTISEEELKSDRIEAEIPVGKKTVIPIRGLQVI